LENAESITFRIAFLNFNSIKMKKTSLIMAFIALFMASISTQSCAKTTKNKAQSSVAVVAPSVEKMPTIEDKKSVEIVAEKPVETTVFAVVDKPIIAEKDTQKSDKKPDAIVETTSPKSVIVETATNTTTTSQVVENKVVTFEKPIETPVKKSDPDHSVWNDLLKKHVSTTGKVNYKGFTDLEILDSYMRSLNENAPSENATKEARLAYWINAYNAVTIRLIVANYPLTSITKLDAGKPWDVKRYSNGGKKMSLNDIENNILRPMGDARIHFALNCAAKSCPPILNEAFTAENVNKLLESRTKQFINSSRTVIEKDAIKVSKIFDWYAKDFGNVVDFVNKYAKVKASKTAKVTYQDYDWSLNE
jgi:Protein of unknown function, DUF547